MRRAHCLAPCSFGDFLRRQRAHFASFNLSATHKPTRLPPSLAGVVKLTDFGFATDRLDVTVAAAAHSFVGTGSYMAPERIRGEPYSYAADIWSIGILTIECAEGRHPLQPRTSSYIDMATAIAKGPPPTLSQPDQFPEAFAS